MTSPDQCRKTYDIAIGNVLAERKGKYVNVERVFKDVKVHLMVRDISAEWLSQLTIEKRCRSHNASVTILKDEKRKAYRKIAPNIGNRATVLSVKVPASKFDAKAKAIARREARKVSKLTKNESSNLVS